MAQLVTTGRGPDDATVGIDIAIAKDNMDVRISGILAGLVKGGALGDAAAAQFSHEAAQHVMPFVNA